MIVADGFQKEYDLREWEQVELPFINTKTLIVFHDNEEINYSSYLKTIGQNTITMTNL